jgi:hypothetical protein
MKRLKFALFFILYIISFTNKAATITAGATGLWSATGTWTGGVVPTSTDSVVIDSYTVTVDVNNAACLGMALGVNTAATLSFNSGSILTITRSIKIGGAGAKRGHIVMTSGGYLKSQAWTILNQDLTYGTGTVEFTAGSFTTAAGFSDFYNLVISGTATVTLGTTTHIYNDITLATGGTLVANNTYIYVSHDWNNTGGSFTEGSGGSSFVVFDGTGTQHIDAETFYHAWFTKTASTQIILDGNVNITAQLWWDNGFVTASSSAKLIFLAGSTIVAAGAGPTRCVTGPVKKVGNTAFDFPLCTCNGTNYSPLSISAPSVATDAYTAEYFGTDPKPSYSTTSVTSPIDHVSRKEYWYVTRDAGTSNVTIKLPWGSWSGSVSSMTDLRVANYTGGSWTNSGNTATSGANAAGTVTSAATSTFGPFTLSSVTSANTLPIELISFKATCENKNRQLTWTTATETNNNFFTVYRSKDAVNWEEMGSVDGKGNSSQQVNYFFIEKEPYTDIAYYLLKQTDFNGNYSYSSPITIYNCEDERIEKINIYPNPTSGKIQLSFENEQENNYSIKIENVFGEEVYSSTKENNPIIDISNYTEGIYFVHITVNSQTIIQKILLKK